MGESIPEVLESLQDQGKGVTVKVVSGSEVTGFIQDVDDDVVRLFVSNQIFFIPIDKIEWVIPVEGVGP